jgi:LEA14-like dessication related protein
MKKLILILVVGLVFFSCEFHEPSFSGLESYKIEKFENNELLVNLVFKLRNDNGFKIKIKPSKMSVFAEDIELGTIFLDKKITFKKKREGIYETKIRIKLADGAMFSMLKFAGKKELNLRFKGKIKGKILFISKKIPIDESKIISPEQLNFKQFLGN